MQNFLFVRLQLGDIISHLLLTGRKLDGELLNAMAYHCEIQRKLCQIA